MRFILAVAAATAAASAPAAAQPPVEPGDTIVVTPIEARRYGSSSDATPHYRLERYTYVLPYVWSSGDRRGRRYLPPRVEYLDLTAEGEAGGAPPAIAPAPASPSGRRQR